MGRLYSAANTATAQTAAQDVIQLLAASNVHVIVHEAWITCTLTTDERNQILVHRGTASGGTAGTENPTETGMPSADSAITFNDTTQNTPSSILIEDQWSCLIPWHYHPAPEGRIHVPGGGSLTFELGEAITSTSISSWILWEEMG